jgi:membrane dipeptidase
MVAQRSLTHEGRPFVVDLHNDLILLVDHFDHRERPDHFADFWLPELRAGGVAVQVLRVRCAARCC